MRVLVLLLLLLSAPAQAAVYTFRSDPLTTGDGAGCADPAHLHCGDIVTAAFTIDDRWLIGATSPRYFSFRQDNFFGGEAYRSPGLLDLGLWLHSSSGAADLSYAVFDPRIQSEFKAMVAPGGALHDVELMVWHDRPDLWIGMGGLSAEALFDDPRAQYFAAGSWEMTTPPALVAAPLPPAGLLLGAGALALAGLRRRR